jgi:hypothetical protein
MLAGLRNRLPAQTKVTVAHVVVAYANSRSSLAAAARVESCLPLLEHRLARLQRMSAATATTAAALH